MLNRMMKWSCSFIRRLWFCTWTFWNCVRFPSYYKTGNHLTTAILWGITSHTLVPEISALHTFQTPHNLIGLCCCACYSWLLKLTFGFLNVTVCVDCSRLSLPEVDHMMPGRWISRRTQVTCLIHRSLDLTPFFFFFPCGFTWRTSPSRSKIIFNSWNPV